MDRVGVECAECYSALALLVSNFCFVVLVKNIIVRTTAVSLLYVWHCIVTARDIREVRHYSKMKVLSSIVRHYMSATVLTYLYYCGPKIWKFVRRGTLGVMLLVLYSWTLMIHCSWVFYPVHVCPKCLFCKRVTFFIQISYVCAPFRCFVRKIRK